MDRIIRVAWYVLLGAFVVSMLTWMPKTWENVFNAGIAFSTIFLSITLITGMGGQLSLCQATLAGVGAFTAAQLANHLGFSLLVGGLIGAVAAAAVAIVLALLSVRLRGLGLALMTIAAALFFDFAVFPQIANSNGSPLNVQPKWVGLGILNPNGHAYFVTAMIVMVICIFGVLLLRRGTYGRFLTAMRGSETASAGLGINLTWQRVMIFGISGVVAGIGGTLLSIQQQSVNTAEFSYQISLAFVVVVVTTGVGTIEGALQAGFGLVVIEQLLTYLPARFGGNSLTFVLFAFGALTYAAHPEGVLEFQKRRWTLRFERLFFKREDEGATFHTGALGCLRRCRRRRARTPTGGERGMTQVSNGSIAPLPETDGPLLRVTGVSKTFGGIAAVSAVSLEVAAGETVGLVGPNGAGKTTLFNCICGQLRPERGSVELSGAELLGIPTYKRARLGISRTYQRVEIFPDMTVEEHLLVALRAGERRTQLWRDLCNLSAPTSEEKARVDAVLELIAIQRQARTPVSALGLGSCRLVELGRALVSEPVLLLADEPSSGLDVRETHDLAQVLRKLQRERGMAMLLVEHDLGMVGEVVDRTVVMNLGEVIAEGSFDEVMADREVRRAYLGVEA